MDDDQLYILFCQRRQFALSVALQRAVPADTQDQILEAASAYVKFIEDNVFSEAPEAQEHVTH